MAETTQKKLVTRDKIVAFLGCLSGTADNPTYTYRRMKNFTSMSTSMNPSEYSRKYVDEASETTDVTGYSPSISYAFDQFTNEPVHDEIIGISKGEKVGSDAVRPVIVVDFTKKDASDNSYQAVKRDYAVIADSDGDDENTYTYSGTFKCKGESVNVKVTSSDNWQTLTEVTSA